MKVRLFAFWQKYKWDNEPRINLASWDMSRINNGSDSDYIPAGDIVVDIEPFPYANVSTSMQIALLRKQHDMHASSASELQMKINELESHHD